LQGRSREGPESGTAKRSPAIASTFKNSAMPWAPPSRPTRAGSMNARSPNRPYAIVLTRFPGGEPHTLRLKAL